MNSRIARRGALAALAATSAMVVGTATSATAAEPEKDAPHAYGLWVEATAAAINVPIGPLAESYLPDQKKNEIVGVPGTNPLVSAGVISSEVNQDDQGNSAKASIADVGLLAGIPGAPGIKVGAISTSCTGNASGITTTGQVAKVTIGGQAIDVIPGETKVVDISIPNPIPLAPKLTIAKLTFNEKIKNADGSQTINGLHLQAIKGNPVIEKLVSGDIILAHSHCSTAALPVPMASGAGLWAGLGLLGAAAIPVGIVWTRRRRAGAAA